MRLARQEAEVRAPAGRCISKPLLAPARSLQMLSAQAPHSASCGSYQPDAAIFCNNLSSLSTFQNFIAVGTATPVGQHMRNEANRMSMQYFC
jgi:hypothetical protein